MRKNVASQVVAFQMNSATDGSAVTTGTPTVYYTIDAGTQGTGAGTATHEGNGQWSYVPAQAETNGTHVAFTMAITGAISQTVNVWPVSFDPTDSVRAGLTALPNAAAGAAGGLPTDSTGKTSFNDISTSDVNTQCAAALTSYDAVVPADLPTNFADLAITATTGQVTVGTNNDKTGYSLTQSFPTNFADMAITATTGQVTVGTNNDKTGYSISGTKTTLDALNDITAAAVRTEMDANSTQLAAIVADTNELQTDWANGGRLDLLIDAILTDTGTTIPGLIAALNDISVADVFTTQMTESYNADGTAPTLAQALFLIMQAATEKAISGTTMTVKKLDGMSTAATFTLDDGTSPTSITRAT